MPVLQLRAERLPGVLALREPLLTARQHEQLLLELLVARLQTLLGARELRAAVVDLRIDLRAELDGFLACLDVSLAPHRLRLAPRVLQELLPRPHGLVEPRGAYGAHDHDA